MQFSSALILKNTTNKRVNFLLKRDYKAFERMENHLAIPRIFSHIWHFLLKFFDKKPIFYLLFFCASFWMLSVEIANAKTFIATAYYSPVPGQEKYHTGTYEGDLALNGGGTH